MSLPVLEAAPGMPAHLVARASTVALPSIDATRKRALLQPRDAHTFSLRCDDELSVVIGDSRFTVIQLVRGTARRIFTTAVADYVSTEHGLYEAARVIERLESAGVVSEERVARSDCETRAADHEHVRIATHSAPFGSGSWRAEVWLRTTLRDEDATKLGAHGDQCLVNVVIFDESLNPLDVP